MQPGVPKPSPECSRANDADCGKVLLGVICPVSAQVEARLVPKVADEVFLPKESGSVEILCKGQIQGSEGE